MGDNPYSSLPDHRFWRKAVTAVAAVRAGSRRCDAFRISREDKCDGRQLLCAGDRPSLAIKRLSLLSRGGNRRKACRRRKLSAAITQCIPRLWQPLYDLAIPELIAALWSFQTGAGLLDPPRGRPLRRSLSARIEPDGYATAEEMRADRRSISPPCVI